MDVSLVFITVLLEDGGGRVIRRLNLLGFHPKGGTRRGILTGS